MFSTGQMGAQALHRAAQAPGANKGVRAGDWLAQWIANNRPGLRRSLMFGAGDAYDALNPSPEQP
jgi:hypothetical protein